MRTYLNDTFLYYAFTKAERELIYANLWQNDGESARDLANRNVCENTYDKVSLPSLAEISNPALGFADNLVQQGKLGEDSARMKRGTDYVNAHCVYTADKDDPYVVNYWTRSPGQNPPTVVYVGGARGVTDNSQYASCTMGVLPIMYVKSK
jgi:hypothetical protein